MPSFDFQTDAIPGIWQFLNGLRRDDLIAELIQNELDAGSSITRIYFERDRLVCEGNGEVVDTHGWERLRFFLGAGDRVPKKRGKFGVKNHGLKACFTIGDHVVIRSGGMCTQQTLYDPSRAPKPHPGAWTAAEADLHAPELGCRIEVPYRRKDLNIEVGERFTFRALRDEEIDKLFEMACDEVPQRFMGAVRPELKSHYTIELIHWKLGTVNCHYSTRTLDQTRTRVIFARSCLVTGAGISMSKKLQEQVYAFELPLGLAEKHEIPEFYRSRNNFFAEVSWSVDQRGRPDAKNGHLRYPIAYVGNGSSSLSGVNASYSAPFVSDTERHGISAQADWFNTPMIRHCDEALVSILRERLLPKYGSDVLSLIGEDPERFREVLTILLARRTIPIAGKSRSGKRVRLLSDIRSGAGWSFIIPCFSWNRVEVSPSLSAICPKQFKQLHPQTPAHMIRHLADDPYQERSLSNVSECPFTVFDETDFVRMVCRETSARFDFPWTQDWANQLTTPNGAARVFDVFLEIEKANGLDNASRLNVLQFLEVPDEKGVLHPLGKLFSTTDVFDYPPGTVAPPLIHRTIRNHALLRREHWRRPRYCLSNVVDAIVPDELTEISKRDLWLWVRANWKNIPSNVRSRFAALPIWPTVSGRRVGFEQLCYPTSRQVREILGTFIDLPSTEVRELSGVRLNGKGTLIVRSKVSDTDVKLWFANHATRFREGQILTQSQLTEFDSYERQLTILAADDSIAPLLKKFGNQMLAVNQLGTLHARSKLHQHTPKLLQLELRPADMLRTSNSELDRVAASRTEPSEDALRRAMQSPPTAPKSWLIRLAEFVKVCEQRRSSCRIQDFKCVLVGDHWYKPDEVAFRGRPDYWGKWKRIVPAKDLSPQEQDVLRKVGVTSGEPTGDTSRAFFQWLGSITSNEILSHLPQISRHLRNPRCVPFGGCDRYTRCIPAENGGTVSLVNIEEACAAGGRVYVDDFPELSDVIRQRNSKLAFVIECLPNDDLSLAEQIRDYGINRLSHCAGEPVKVEASNLQEADHDLHLFAQYLQSSEFARELPRRLSQWDVPTTNLLDDWRTRLSQELAPEGSYAYFEENRRYLIAAHHPDQVHAGGAREGANLLILCQRHHQQIGDAASRSHITEALLTATNRSEIRFQSPGTEEVKLEGVVVEISTIDGNIPIFFELAHRDIWIER